MSRESRLKRGAILIAVAASLMCYASPAAAKGNTPTRAYAVVTGPDLAHPIVFVASWKESVGGFSAGEGLTCGDTPETRKGGPRRLG